MDETVVWNNMVCNTTVEIIWSKEVPIKLAGHDKVCVLVCLTGKADGSK